VTPKALYAFLAKSVQGGCLFLVLAKGCFASKDAYVQVLTLEIIPSYYHVTMEICVI